MTSHTGRLYALAFALVAFFLAWAVVAARPWATAADPRLRTLAAREAQLRREAKLVNEVVAQRWALYRTELKARRSQNAATQNTAPATTSAVRVVTLPPLTITRTS